MYQGASVVALCGASLESNRVNTARRQPRHICRAVPSAWDPCSSCGCILGLWPRKMLQTGFVFQQHYCDRVPLFKLILPYPLLLHAVFRRRRCGEWWPCGCFSSVAVVFGMECPVTRTSRVTRRSDIRCSVGWRTHTSEPSTVARIFSGAGKVAAGFPSPSDCPSDHLHSQENQP